MPLKNYVSTLKDDGNLKPTRTQLWVNKSRRTVPTTLLSSMAILDGASDNVVSISSCSFCLLDGWMAGSGQ